MIWVLEREADRLTCEIRRAARSECYEFSLGRSGALPEIRTFASATDLIDQYLLELASLQADGWRPRRTDAVLSELQ